MLEEEEDNKVVDNSGINEADNQVAPDRQQMVFEPEKNKKLRKLLDNYLNSIP